MRFVRKALHEIYGALIAAGWLWIGLPPDTSRTRRPRALLAQPPRGHPERLRPDIALSATELSLQRQLMEPSGEHR
ncbi:DUF6059 family protein [Streptomyces sp. NPDC047000]|uniref:DUF6059 family protein n=1 Tax=Streptomyces sp. NPDC047000 TaxID=3155474 RepID=UPI0033D62FC1